MQRFLKRLLNDRLRDFEIAHHAEFPAQPPIFGKLSSPLPEAIADALLKLGISALYSHQALALEHIRSGRHTVVSTPTSSGKSLIYNLAVAEALIRNPDRRALYLFPIKALAHDQLDSLQKFFAALPGSEGGCPLTSCIYDGDTTPYQRAKIRQHHPNVLLTNPDMLHYALLAFHNKWEEFWKRLRYVIIDEMHTYRGIFGSHVAQVFRRLRRICRYYGSSPRFILLSATIGNPGELAGRLTGVPPDEIAVVSGVSGAPQAKRHFVFLRPVESRIAHSAGTAARLIVQAAKAGLKTIAFTQSRKLTELVHMSVIEMDHGLRNKVSSYRAGFLPEERRVIEQKLSSGSLCAVISTSALELGIDIGGLDLCILVGYPGTVMTTWQRGGRVGRSGRESAIVLIPDQDALDQYIVNHPDRFLESRYENAVIDPFNSEILKAHLPCAAAELPICSSDEDFCEEKFSKALNELTSCGRLIQTFEGDQWICAASGPHRLIDIRSVGPSYTITTASNGQTSTLGKNEGIRALKECHPGAIYLHRGETYSVESLDLEKKLIHVTPANVPLFTRAVGNKETEILEGLASKPAGNFIIRMGRLRVTENITAYEVRRLFSHALISKNPLDLPPQTFETVGFWIEIEPILETKVRKAGLDFMGGIHAIEHALISMFPLFAVCDRNDIGGISIPLHPQIEKGAIFVYDGYPGGIGLAARGYDIIMPLIERTKELIASCGCSKGCPACIHSPKCGSGNKPLDKEAALDLLRYLSAEKNLGDNNLECEKTAPEVSCAPAKARRPYRDLRIGFFDLETRKLAQEVGGWQNTHLMRVSVAVLHEVPADTFKVYREHEIQQLIEDLKGLDLIVGFNISRFDYRVLRAYTPFDLERLPTFDILGEIQKSLGFRLSLGHLAEKTLGRPKGGDGLQAVRWFRQGEWENLITYCTEDVIITRDLFYHGLEKGYLVYSDKSSRLLRIGTPWKIDDLVLAENRRTTDENRGTLDKDTCRAKGKRL
ncbi:MAG TPA: DEAD/DEAH box helicase [Deltaproteobacteria bacterium]|nr:DEAD/DEAH box helicase [Deltaproteobacteria bacterium]